MSAEAWLPAAGFSGYRVSSLGRVGSDRGKTPGRIMKPTPDRLGYLSLRITSDTGTLFTSYVHRMVARAFLGEPTDVLVRHLDGDKLNNLPENLAYGSYQENALDTVRHGHHYWAEKTECKSGHPFSEENTYWRLGTNSRTCRECGRASTRRYKARKAAA